MCYVIGIYLYSAKRMMKYNPGKIVTHGYKLKNVSLIIFHACFNIVVENDIQKDIFLIIN